MFTHLPHKSLSLRGNIKIFGLLLFWAIVKKVGQAVMFPEINTIIWQILGSQLFCCSILHPLKVVARVSDDVITNRRISPPFVYDQQSPRWLPR